MTCTHYPEGQGSGVTPAGPGLRPFGVEPQDASQAKPLVPNAVRLSANERQVLLGMWSEHSSEFDGLCGAEASWFMPFKVIQQASEISQHLVRRTVRALKRKGLTGYSNMLMSDDGRVLGAGYGLTRAGRELASAIEAQRAATPQSGAVYESAVGDSRDAQGPSA